MIRILQIVFCIRHPGPFILAVFAFSILWTSLSGCGYRCAERVESLPPWIKTVYVAPWTNRSNELLLGVWITEELRHEFLRGRGLKLVPKDEADVILEGEIADIGTYGLSYVRYDQTIERRIYATCSSHLKHRESGKVIWQTGNIVREEAFVVGKNVIETEGLKDEALQKLSSDVADIVYHRITGVF